MATINGAKALNKEEEIGSISVGKKADLITIELESSQLTPGHGKKGLISNLIYSFNGEVEDVFVDGELIIQEGIHASIDEQKLMGRAEKKSKKFL